MATSFIPLVFLPGLRGPSTPIFLTCFLTAALGYVLAIFFLKKDEITVHWVFGFAIAFRLILLFSSPSLSDDVYRYIWDGHLLNSGVSPYLMPVNDPLLDTFDLPLRSLVNHSWMASPYLPVTQLVNAAAEFIIPQSVKIFQLTALTFDLLIGWLVFDLLGRFGLPRRNVLIYLWNPLVIIEFAHGAHVDSLMIFLTMLAFWYLARDAGKERADSPGSALALAAAALTKLIPILLVPIFWWRWSWKNRLTFGTVLLGMIAVFSLNAGLGLFGPLDGTGVFGAVRIYLAYWKFNSGIPDWLEGLISGFAFQNAFPLSLDGETQSYIVRIITASFLVIFFLLAGWLAWKSTYKDQEDHPGSILKLIRLSLIPLGAYLLLTPTVHPWYVTFVIPFLPFFFTDDKKYFRYLFPWIYFSIVVAFSYLAYLDPNDFRELRWVRLLEYIPFYGLLIWPMLVFMKKIRKSNQISSH